MLVDDDVTSFDGFATVTILCTSTRHITSFDVLVTCCNSTLVLRVDPLAGVWQLWLAHCGVVSLQELENVVLVTNLMSEV